MGRMMKCIVFYQCQGKHVTIYWKAFPVQSNDDADDDDDDRRKPQQHNRHKTRVFRQLDDEMSCYSSDHIGMAVAQSQDWNILCAVGSTNATEFYITISTCPYFGKVRNTLHFTVHVQRDIRADVGYTVSHVDLQRYMCVLNAVHSIHVVFYALDQSDVEWTPSTPCPAAHWSTETRVHVASFVEHDNATSTHELVYAGQCTFDVEAYIASVLHQLHINPSSCRLVDYSTYILSIDRSLLRALVLVKFASASNAVLLKWRAVVFQIAIPFGTVKILQMAKCRDSPRHSDGLTRRLVLAMRAKYAASVMDEVCSASHDDQPTIWTNKMLIDQQKSLHMVCNPQFPYRIVLQ